MHQHLKALSEKGRGPQSDDVLNPNCEDCKMTTAKTLFHWAEKGHDMLMEQTAIRCDKCHLWSEKEGSQVGFMNVNILFSSLAAQVKQHPPTTLT